ncbi:hypothetical protein [Rhodoglobus aureus]|uniref:hypothetical protein n=1 Tax=Rhodoglobus aureus TaxID=191497 RepID=UPI0031D47ECE
MVAKACFSSAAAAFHKLAFAHREEQGEDERKSRLSEYQTTFDDLEAGRITGRAVLIP